MSEGVRDILLFVLQWLLLLGIVAAVVVVCLALLGRARQSGSPHSRQLRIDELNDRYRSRRQRLQLARSAPGDRKRSLKAWRHADKRRRKHGDDTLAGTVWVIEFHGDIKASATPRLAEEISALLEVAEEGDEVVVLLESAGGLVHAYGLAAAQLDRLREAGIATTVCVDKVAASGGYMMACTAQRLRVAPFAVLGSIGVVAQLPNVHRLLKRHDIDVDVMTAGRYKRTLTVFGENTDEGREKFIEDLEGIHSLFKSYVAARRPQLDIESVATGEIWYGSEALGKGLADEVGTSEAYLLQRMKEARVFKVSLEARKGLGERLGLSVSQGVERGVERTLEVLDASRWLRR
ncbi:serine protease SohB [Franzmannia pantelleriensis]|uniref:Serine protease SohB n=1 Tax=Franzmannia pantelleriensis TaxID=48727 RepID=A0A1G9FE61_9GAMM|nr:protease SohB [Halomonas pantelleriensis]SDK86668.1 serine protease SohB [Halomonas pantelleriensis]